MQHSEPMRVQENKQPNFDAFVRRVRCKADQPHQFNKRETASLQQHTRNQCKFKGPIFTNYIKRMMTKNKIAQINKNSRAQRAASEPKASNYSAGVDSEVDKHMVDPVLINRVVIKTLCTQNVDLILSKNDNTDNDEEKKEEQKNERKETAISERSHEIVGNEHAGCAQALQPIQGSLSMYISSKVEHVRSQSGALALQRREGNLCIDPLECVGEIMRDVRQCRANCDSIKSAEAVQQHTDYLAHVAPAPVDTESRTRLQVKQTRLLMERADEILGLSLQREP